MKYIILFILAMILYSCGGTAPDPLPKNYTLRKDIDARMDSLTEHYFQQAEYYTDIKRNDSVRFYLGKIEALGEIDNLISQSLDK